MRNGTIRKRVGVAALCLALLLPTSSSFGVLAGDMDGDSRLTILDLVRFYAVYTARIRATERDLILGDLTPVASSGTYVNHRWAPKNGILDPDDLLGLARCVVGLASPRELGPIVYNVGGWGSTVLQDPLHNPSQSQNDFSESITLYAPYDLALAPGGEIYFTEFSAHRVRVRDRKGMVRTVAGGPSRGFVDGPPGQARFFSPEGIALLPDGSLIVADTYNHAVRKIAPDGETTTLAGNGKRGNSDGIGREAAFREPNGVATDPSGNVYVADTLNNLIRKITPEGIVTTIAGTGVPGLEEGPALETKLYSPSGVFFDPRDRGLFIADMGSNTVRKLTAEGQLVTLAGQLRYGHVDGFGSEARFSRPYGVELDSQGRLWIADWGNESVRILHPDGRVETVAGQLPQGHRNGPAGVAKFRGLMNVRIGRDGVVYLADTDNQRIRALAP